MTVETLIRTEQPTTPSLRLSEVLAALTRAFDITEGLLPGHAARTCYLAMRIAERLRLDERSRSDLFYTALLKDAGCSANAARVCQIYGADDRALKREYIQIDTTHLLACARYLVTHIGPDDPWAKRLLRLAGVAVQGLGMQREVEFTRCEQGAMIARRLGFGEAVAEAVHAVGEAWNGKGQPLHLRGDAIPLLSRIVAVAQTVDIFSRPNPAAAIDVASARRGHALDPDVVDAFLELAGGEGAALWRELEDNDAAALIGDQEPGNHQIAADTARLDQVALAFAEVIDAKSPFTGRHSYNVALISEAMGRRLGLDGEQCRTLRWAGLVHDIGKLGVPNTILDKPGRLTEAEMAIVRRHPAYALDIVGRVPVLHDVAELAACHHERLDGRGYFRGLRAEQISLSARTIAVADIWEALTVDRPYRKAMSGEEALATLGGMVGDHVALEAFTALKAIL